MNGGFWATRATADAIEYCAFAVQWAKETGYDPAFIESHTAWIAALQAGENPFDAATLQGIQTP